MDVILRVGSKFKISQILPITFSLEEMTRLLFSIEQWELVRRLRNSGLTKEQVCQAFDDLERMEKELGGLYSVPVNWSPNQSQGSPTPSSAAVCNSSGSSTTGPDTASIVKSVQLLMAKNLAAINNQHQRSTLNSSSSNNGHLILNKNENNEQTNANLSSAAVALVNNHFSNTVDAEQEGKEIDEFRKYAFNFYRIY